MIAAPFRIFGRVKSDRASKTRVDANYATVRSQSRGENAWKEGAE